MRRPARLVESGQRTGIDEKAAVLLESLVRNHALVDGNNRIGWLSGVMFYGLSDLQLDAPDDGAHDLVIAMASGNLTCQQAATHLAIWHQAFAAGACDQGTVELRAVDQPFPGKRPPR